jgi:dTDP-4-dehydrorhamnose 3,5-epimerase
MEIEETELPGVLLVKPKVFGDARGGFMEMWNAERYAEAGLDWRFVQDNVSRSKADVVRGIHSQHPRAQGKLVQVLQGAVWDVAVDLRCDSPHFGRWAGRELTGENAHQLWVPPGFGHGFCVLSDETIFVYKCTDLYAPDCEVGVAWDDPEIGITWPCSEPLLSEKDKALPRLADVPRESLPTLADYG